MKETAVNMIHLAQLEFTGALKDSPSFRHSLHAHEIYISVLDAKSRNVVKLCSHMVDTGETFLQSFNSLIHGIQDLSSTCFGSDEPVCEAFTNVTGILEEIVKYQKVLIEQARWSIMKNITEFLKKELMKTREVKTHFEKVSCNLDEALLKNSNISKHKYQEAGEARNELTAVGTCFAHTALDYLFQINLIHAKKRHELIDSLLSFLGACHTYFQQGSALFAGWQDKQAENIASSVGEMKLESKKLEKKMQDRHSLVPKEIFQHPPGMPVDPDVVMEGFLFKKASKSFKSFKRRWFFIRNGQLCYRKRDVDASEGAGDMILPDDEWAARYSVMAPDLRVCLVRSAPNHVDRQYSFELVTPNKIHLLQADSESLCNAWIKALQRTIEAALHDGPSRNSWDSDSTCLTSGNGSLPSISPEIPSKPGRVIHQILSLPGNELCADCGAGNPQWASINLGITLCIGCCGIHRSLSVQVSKPRSLTLDAWEPEIVKLMLSLGNAMVNRFYLAYWSNKSLPIAARPDSNQAVRDAWIRAKYVEKRFASAGEALRLTDALRPMNIDEQHYSPDDNLDVIRSERAKSTSNCDGSAESEVSMRRLTNGDSPRCRLVKSMPSLMEMINESLKIDTSSGTTLLTSACSESNIMFDETGEGGRQDTSRASLALYVATGNHDFEGIVAAMAKGASINAHNPRDKDRTPLFEAVRIESAEITEFLLLNGAKVNVQDLEGTTPLHIASGLGNTRFVIQLLKRGANQELTSLDGKSALDLAMDAESADVVTLLRLAKLNAEIRDDEEWSGRDDSTFTDVLKDFTSIAANTPERLRKKSNISEQSEIV